MRNFILPITLLLLAGCQPSTSLSTSWRDPAAGPINFKKVAVVVLNSSPGQRRAQEDTIVGEIKRSQAIASYTLVSDDELQNKEAAKAKVIAEGFDGAVLVRMLDTQAYTTYVPGAPTGWNDWGRGYAVTNQFVRAEIALYTVPQGKLIWSGVSETMDPKDASAFAREVAQAAANELRKQKLLP